MNLLKDNRGQSSRDDESGLIPMINVVFLLLVFFMIAGQIMPHDPKLQLPESQSRQALEQGMLDIGIDANGTVSINGAPLVGDLQQRLQSLVADGQVQLICRVHRELPSKALDPVIRVLRRLQLGQFRLVTVAQ